MAKTSLTIAIGGEYDNKAIGKAKQDLESLQTEAAKSVGGVSSTLVNAGEKLDATGSKLSSTGDKISSVGGKISAISVPVAAAGAACVKAFTDVEEGANNVKIATGSVGDDAKELVGVYEQVAGSVSGSFGDIGAAVGEVNTRLGLNGDELRDASEQAMKFAKVNGVDSVSAIQSVTKMMNNAGIEAGEYGHYLDVLTVAAQASGINVETLADLTTKNAAAFRELGFTTEESIAMLADFEKAGVDTSGVLAGMKKGIATWAKQGKDAGEGFAEFVKGVQDGSITSADAIELFGSKAGVTMYDAAKQGMLNFDEMYESISNGADGALDSIYEETLTLQDKMEIAGKQLETSLAGFGEVIMDTVMPLVDDVCDGIEDLTKWFTSLDDDTKDLIVKAGMFVTAAGPAVAIIGKLTSGTGKLISSIGSGVKKFATFTSGVKNMSKEELVAYNNSVKAQKAIDKMKGSTDSAKASVKSFGENTKTASANTKVLGDNAKTAATNAKELGDNASKTASSTKSMGDNLNAAATNTEKLSKQATTAKANVKDLSTNLESAGRNSSAVSTNMQTAATNAEKLGTSTGSAKVNVKELSTNAQSASTNVQSMGNNISTANQHVTALDTATGNAKNNVKSLGDTASASKDGITQSANATKQLGDNANAASKGTGALKGGMELLDGICKTAAIGLAVGLIGDLVGQFVSYQEHAQKVEDATTGLEGAFGLANSSFSEYSQNLQTVQTDIDSVVSSADECIQKQADLAQKARDIWADYGNNKGELEYYVAEIDNLRDKTGLTADEQERLKLAVDKYNEITGDNLEVIDQQNGKLSESKNHIEAVSRAWLENAKIEAIKDLYSDAIRQQVEDTRSLEDAQKKLQEAEEGWGIWLGDFALIADPASVEYHDLKQKVDDLAAAEKSAGDMVEYYGKLLGQTPQYFATFEDALESTGTSIEDLGATSEEELQSIKDDFDGTLESIVKSCEKHGAAIPTAIANAVEANKGAARTKLETMMDYVIDGLGSSVESNKGKFDLAASAMTNYTLDAFKKKNGINSPSTLYKEQGGYIVDGLALGVTSNESTMTSAMGRLSNAAYNKLNGMPNEFGNVGRISVEQVANGMDQRRSNVSTSAQNVAISADNGLGSVKTNNAGNNFVSGFINGMQGVNVWNVAWNIGISALNAIKGALGIHSPSKEAQMVGEYFGEGAAIGVEESTKSVVDSAYSMGVDAADALQSGLSTSTASLTADTSYTMADIRSFTKTSNPYTYANPVQTPPQRSQSQAQSIVVNMNVNVNASNTSEASAIGKTLGEELYAEMARKMRGL